MPELPEVEVIVRSLIPRLLTRTIDFAQLFHPIASQSPSAFQQKLQGRRITHVGRKGKYLIIVMSDETALVIHLGMTGQLFFAPHILHQDEHTHFVIRFVESNESLWYRDVRKFGYVGVHDARRLDHVKRLHRLGTDVLHIPLTQFLKRLAWRKGAIKATLLNQSIVSGLGNIYVDEALFRAHLHPLRSSRTLSKDELTVLHRVTKRLLRQAIVHEGSSTSDFITPTGARGRFQRYHRVYSRAGEPCVNCGEAIQKIMVAGRSSCFCRQCQPLN